MHVLLLLLALLLIIDETLRAQRACALLAQRKEAQQRLNRWRCPFAKDMRQLARTHIECCHITFTERLPSPFNSFVRGLNHAEHSEGRCSALAARRITRLGICRNRDACHCVRALDATLRVRCDDHVLALVEDWTRVSVGCVDASSSSCNMHSQRFGPPPPVIICCRRGTIIASMRRPDHRQTNLTLTASTLSHARPRRTIQEQNVEPIRVDNRAQDVRNLVENRRSVHPRTQRAHELRERWHTAHLIFIRGSGTITTWAARTAFLLPHFIFFAIDVIALRSEMKNAGERRHVCFETAR